MKSIFVSALVLLANAVNVREGDGETVSIATLDSGTDQMCQTGQTASVHYTGALKSNGQVFDSSIPRGEPIQFMIGDFRVIKCWEQAIV